MAFLETPRFPDDISLGAVGGPGFLTDIVIVNSGQEYRNQVRTLELGSWDVAHAARLPTQYRQLQAFFRVAAGRANGFRFKDWTDFEVTGSQGVLTLASAGVYQLYKRYTFGSYTYDRKIQKPINGTVTISGSTGSLDYATGLYTLGTGTPTSWIGEFDVPCRFDTDEMRAETINRSGTSADLIIGWSSIPVREIRL